MKITAILACFLAVLLLNSAARAQISPEAAVVPDKTTTAPDPSGFHERHPRYRLTPGDSVQISFRFTPEYNQTVSVQPDGFVALDEVGAVYIQGMTAPEAAELIRKAYGQILRDPVVTLALKDFEQPFFIANGQVRSPGKYELRSELSVSEGIALAGGFTDSAKHSEVWLYRRLANGTLESKKINVKQMMKQGDRREDVVLRAGDMIFVPQNTFSKLKGIILPRATVGPVVR